MSSAMTFHITRFPFQMHRCVSI